ncbi:hypothetical protein GCM10023158_18320 [Gluconacetobacter tumulicola]
MSERGEKVQNKQASHIVPQISCSQASSRGWAFHPILVFCDAGLRKDEPYDVRRATKEPGKGRARLLGAVRSFGGETGQAGFLSMTYAAFPGTIPDSRPRQPLVGSLCRADGFKADGGGSECALSI